MSSEVKHGSMYVSSGLLRNGAVPYKSHGSTTIVLLLKNCIGHEGSFS